MEAWQQSSLIRHLGHKELFCRPWEMCQNKVLLHCLSPEKPSVVVITFLFVGLQRNQDIWEKRILEEVSVRWEDPKSHC